MSLSLNFEPHSYYMGWAIKYHGKMTWDNPGNERGYIWEAFTDDGNTYRILQIEADTLKELKELIKERETK